MKSFREFFQKLAEPAARGVTLALLLLSLVGAAGAASADNGDPLDELLAGMASSRGVRADFVESKQVSLLSQPVESRGELYFLPPDRMVRRTLEPARSELWISGDQVRFRVEQEEEVDLSQNPAARAFVDNFVAIFRGDRAELERRYRVKFEAAPSAEGSWTLRLAPRPPVSRFLREIVVAGDGRALRELVLLEQDGDQTTTHFTNVEYDRLFAEPEITELFGPSAP